MSEMCKQLSPDQRAAHELAMREFEKTGKFPSGAVRWQQVRLPDSAQQMFQKAVRHNQQSGHLSTEEAETKAAVQVVESMFLQVQEPTRKNTSKATSSIKNHARRGGANQCQTTEVQQKTTTKIHLKAAGAPLRLQAAEQKTKAIIGNAAPASGADGFITSSERVVDKNVHVGKKIPTTALDQTYVNVSSTTTSWGHCMPPTIRVVTPEDVAKMKREKLIDPQEDHDSKRGKGRRVQQPPKSPPPKEAQLQKSPQVHQAQAPVQPPEQQLSASLASSAWRATGAGLASCPPTSSVVVPSYCPDILTGFTMGLASRQQERTEMLNNLVVPNKQLSTSSPFLYAQETFLSLPSTTPDGAGVCSSSSANGELKKNQDVQREKAYEITKEQKEEARSSNHDSAVVKKSFHTTADFLEKQKSFASPAASVMLEDVATKLVQQNAGLEEVAKTFSDAIYEATGYRASLDEIREELKKQVPCPSSEIDTQHVAAATSGRSVSATSAPPVDQRSRRGATAAPADEIENDRSKPCKIKTPEEPTVVKTAEVDLNVDHVPTSSAANIKSGGKKRKKKKKKTHKTTDEGTSLREQPNGFPRHDDAMVLSRKDLPVAATSGRAEEEEKLPEQPTRSKLCNKNDSLVYVEGLEELSTVQGLLEQELQIVDEILQHHDVRRTNTTIAASSTSRTNKDSFEGAASGVVSPAVATGTELPGPPGARTTFMEEDKAGDPLKMCSLEQEEQRPHAGTNCAVGEVEDVRAAPSSTMKNNRCLPTTHEAETSPGSVLHDDEEEPAEMSMDTELSSSTSHVEIIVPHQDYNVSPAVSEINVEVGRGNLDRYNPTRDVDDLEDLHPPARKRHCAPGETRSRSYSSAVDLDALRVVHPAEARTIDATSSSSSGSDNRHKENKASLVYNTEQIRQASMDDERKNCAASTRPGANMSSSASVENDDAEEDRDQLGHYDSRQEGTEIDTAAAQALPVVEGPGDNKRRAVDQSREEEHQARGCTTTARVCEWDEMFAVEETRERTNPEPRQHQRETTAHLDCARQPSVGKERDQDEHQALNVGNEVEEARCNTKIYSEGPCDPSVYEEDQHHHQDNPAHDHHLVYSLWEEVFGLPSENEWTAMLREQDRFFSGDILHGGLDEERTTNFYPERRDEMLREMKHGDVLPQHNYTSNLQNACYVTLCDAPDISSSPRREQTEELFDLKDSLHACRDEFEEEEQGAVEVIQLCQKTRTSSTTVQSANTQDCSTTPRQKTMATTLIDCWCGVLRLVWSLWK
ncbi:unnamed protein product [Amoebophrya sp. A120]|nr:unnamed protein product [Amoebophrya sp. A120]|eukprot:GSA120T00010909001.1